MGVIPCDGADARRSGRRIGTLYQLLPPESRRRTIDTAGVARMHEALRHLSR
jgi:hypothetical protein